MKRISQCCIPQADEEKFSYFFKKYSLTKYRDHYAPTIFFSGWKMGPIKNHKGFGLVIWRGSDINEKKLSALKKKKNIFHLAISSFIEDDLKKSGIKYKFLPIVGKKMSYYNVRPLGDEIYTYIPDVHPGKYHERYGMKIVKKIQKSTKYKINIIGAMKYSRKELADIYGRCFCGLRMTKHDGLPNQVIEMGLMGRRSFYNGNIPGSIKWNKNNIDGIVSNIEKEAENIGSVNEEYASSIRDFIAIGDNWLDVGFWKKGK